MKFRGMPLQREPPSRLRCRKQMLCTLFSRPQRSQKDMVVWYSGISSKSHCRFYLVTFSIYVLIWAPFLGLLRSEIQALIKCGERTIGRKLHMYTYMYRYVVITTILQLSRLRAAMICYYIER